MASPKRMHAMLLYNLAEIRDLRRRHNYSAYLLEQPTFMTPIHNMGVGVLSNISSIDDLLFLLQQLLQNNSSNHIRAKSPVINV